MKLFLEGFKNYFYHQNKKFLKIEKINKINESIQKIKNTTESRIML